jgi:hypothetical protein
MGESCPLCAGRWDVWELTFPSLPQEELAPQLAEFIAQLPPPAALELEAASDGAHVRLLLPPGRGDQLVATWSALARHQSHWVPAEPGGALPETRLLRTGDPLPALASGEGDRLLALAGEMAASGGRLRVWLLGRDERLQAELRRLSGYTYGSAAGVAADEPNWWARRLRPYQLLAFAGMVTAGVSGGVIAVQGSALSPALGGVLGGAAMTVGGALGVRRWTELRSVPRELLVQRAGAALLSTAVTWAGPSDSAPPRLLAGDVRWEPLDPAEEWPGVRRAAFPLDALDAARLFTPPQGGLADGIIAPGALQDVPTPGPSAALVRAPLKIGVAVAGGRPIGIDPDGHGLIVGGSRTGKSSLAYAVLKAAALSDDPPGIFLVDPHLTLADAFLTLLDELPEPERGRAISRLRVISPTQPELVPLNLVAIPEVTWAEGALVQLGQRIWADYWGPRMQAALLGLFRLAHAWNQHHEKKLGLMHVVFAAFNADWRHQALAYLSPAERMGTLALDQLLGQTSDKTYSWAQGWVTEVVSPILSKVMALEISPWLFAAMHQPSFVPLQQWIAEKDWVVLRLPAGEMGDEGARLTAAVIYNVFDAAFHRATQNGPIPTYFVIDEAQQIAGGMRLESLLSEGGKFGARAVVRAQSLARPRRVPGFEPTVQALLANTSTQAFFSPNPEDADLVRAALSSTLRYGPNTLDLPTLTCWLRARLDGRWQPPTLLRADPLPTTDRPRVERFIREVIAAHPEDYLPAESWQEATVGALTEMVPPAQQRLLSELFAPGEEPGQSSQSVEQDGDPLHLGGL